MRAHGSGDARRESRRNVWVDANVVLRFLTGSPPEMAEQARLFFSRVGADLQVRVSPITIAEIVWTLESYYGFDRKRIGEVVSAFCRSPGVLVLEQDAILEALADYSAKNVDFADAYLAAQVIRYGAGVVATFDEKHFSRPKVQTARPDLV